MDLSDNQIQILERTFKVFLYPDETQRAHLGRELGMQPQQIKFWFKNRRAQMRRCLCLKPWQATDEQVDNHLSDSENHEIDSENDEIDSENDEIHQDKFAMWVCGWRADPLK
ncbi:hypothetical protein CFC21_086732 [Triticum aestivum]|uniref:Homeobox domain-containing protein n=2 Tax=Triticum aestivum TaxID=4565 RepID=A0A3B6PF98_WHEAT|nr:homeobox-leucine zipper protein ROC8-like [Triticum aestivum]KAF7082898.1 hypothetical protein CFC21_086732 [Triticum aestivum]